MGMEAFRSLPWRTHFSALKHSGDELMDDYLKEEGEAIKRLEKAEFTEEQIGALYHYLEFKLTYQNEYRDTVLSDAKIELRRDIRRHGHLDGKVVSEF